jgi:phospho-N-acetylmuramoyl-pentapeptide-transferase
VNVAPWLIQHLAAQFWIAFAVSALCAYPIWRLLLLTKSRQTVSEYAPEGHQVKQGTPTMGGLIIMAGYLAAVVGSYFLPIPSEIAYLDRVKPAILVLAIGFMLVGFVDDFVVPRMIKGKRGLGWKQKILMQFGLAIFAAGINYGWQIDFPFAASVFLILFFSNAYNFSDGLDGLSGTLLLGLVAGIVGIGLLTAWMEPVLAMVLPFAGAVIPFLYLNSPPAKVFMGDAGSLPIGAVLGLAVSCLTFAPGWSLIDATTSLASAGSSPVNAACTVLALIMVVELVPVPLQILSVKLRKKRLFPYTPIHHAFEKAGWPETRVVGLFSLTQLVLAFLAVTIVALRFAGVL